MLYHDMVYLAGQDLFWKSDYIFFIIIFLPPVCYMDLLNSSASEVVSSFKKHGHITFQGSKFLASVPI